jgi:hypothetical protein
MKTIAQQLNVTEFPFIIKDNNGNPIYFEDSNNYWAKWEYDSNGYIIYYENSNNYWAKWEYDYDSNGNEIYYENSNNYWAKWEYDSKGNEIYSESSNGKITDNRPKPCENKVVEIDGIKYKLTAV